MLDSDYWKIEIEHDKESVRRLFERLGNLIKCEEYDLASHLAYEFRLALINLNRSLNSLADIDG